jgi:Helix-turn-helix domain
MSWEGIFRIFIRIVFLFAYGAFLSASIRHVATFFHNFEPDTTGWNSSYTLAISIDATALVLTIGVMFFRKSMPGLALGVVWFFIVALTAFSWLVNWEYAMRYQSTDLTTDPLLKLLNPILASSFAFLNLAYSVVAEFFNTRKQTAEDVAKEADRLEALVTEQRRLEVAKARVKKPSLIQRAKELALEAKTAAHEVIGERDEYEETSGPSQEALPEKLEHTLQFLAEHPELADHWGTGSDAQLAAYLGLPREASVRFWRFKAMELWPEYSASKRNQHIALRVSGKDATNDGDLADTSADETLEHSASSRRKIGATRTDGNATHDNGKNQSEQAGKTSSRTTTRDGSTTPLSVTVKEAATMLGLSESYIRELRNNKRLRSPGRNKKLLLVSSLKAYQETRQKPELNEQRTHQESTLQNGSGNGDIEAVLSLGEYPHVTA